MSKKLLRKKLALMLANLKKKRPYYVELEYLEATGTQYIDTGLYGTTQSQVDIVFGMTSAESSAAYNGAVFGGRTSQTSNTFTMFKLASATPQYFRFDYNGQRQAANANQITWNNTSKYRFEYDSTKCLTTNITTGESHSENLVPPSSITTSTICLFCVNTSGTKGTYFSGRIYRYWYTDGTNSIDLIPVLDWNYVPCMYDRVTDQLFYNAGTGNFIAGREIHPVEYIEAENSGGNLVEYAVGNYRLTDTTDWEITFSAESPGNNWVIGQRNWVGVHYRKDATTSNLPRIGITNGSAAANQCYVDYTNNEKITLALKGTDVYANGTKVGSIRRVSALDAQTKYGIFAYKDINQELPNLRIPSARIYRLKIWDNGVLVQDLIPAIDENGVGGFFENVSRTFIDKESNSNSEFQYPAREVEYLTSNGGQYIDTGIQPTDDYGYRIKNTYTAGGGEQCAIGCMDSGNRFVGVYTSGSSNAISGAWGSFVNFLPSYPWTTGTILDVKCNYKNNRKITIDNTEVKDISDIHITGTISNSIYIGARNHGSNVTKMKGKIYGAEITNGQNVVADFIPAFKDGQIGMYDKVSGVLKTNIGTGSFVAGAVKEPEYE